MFLSGLNVYTGRVQGQGEREVNWPYSIDDLHAMNTVFQPYMTLYLRPMPRASSSMSIERGSGCVFIMGDAKGVSWFFSAVRY